MTTNYNIYKPSLDLLVDIDRSLAFGIVYCPSKQDDERAQFYQYFGLFLEEITKSNIPNWESD